MAQIEDAAVSVGMARLAQGFEAALVSSLRRYRTVPDSVLLEALSDWESDAGQWYVEAYSLAVVGAIRSAGRRVAASLERSH